MPTLFVCIKEKPLPLEGSCGSMWAMHSKAKTQCKEGSTTRANPTPGVTLGKRSK